MAKLTREQNSTILKRKLLYSAAKLFITNGYTATSLRKICDDAKVNIGSFVNLYGCKENLMRDLVKYVLEAQFEKTEKFIEDIPHTQIQMYAAETALQLYMAESNENIRELYVVAYSLPNTSEIIQEIITGKLENIFKDTLPELETKDFYILEIASGGIMRGFLTKPCNMWFTMNDKIKSFLEITLHIFNVPHEQTAEAVEFVKNFDFHTIARETIDTVLEEITEAYN